VLVRRAAWEWIKARAATRQERERNEPHKVAEAKRQLRRKSHICRLPNLKEGMRGCPAKVADPSNEVNVERVRLCAE